MALSLKNRISADYLLTFLAEFMVLVAGIYVYRFAAKHLGDDGFSGYAISRRTISFIQPLLIIGLGVGIPRYVAFSMADKSLKRSGSYFIAGILLMLAVTTPLLLGLLFFREAFAQLFFDSTKYAGLIFPMAVMLIGLVVHAISYGYFRGRVMMIHANVMQLINLGIIPLLAFIIAHDLGSVLLVTGISWLIVPILFSVFMITGMEWKKEEIKPCIHELFIYGIQRMPGDVALAGFLALPAYFTAHMVDDQLKTAGNVAFGMSMLNLAGAAFGPICLMLLPKASQVIVIKDYTLLKRYTNLITIWTIGLTVVGLILAELFASFIISIYLGEGREDLVHIMRIILLGCLGYTLYISLRSILDAYYVKAMNTINIFISFAVFLIAGLIAKFTDASYMDVVFAFVASMLLLGALTTFETYRIFRKDGVKA